MSEKNGNVKVTGVYAFSFTTYIWEHDWDGNDYAYFHDVDEQEGEKVFRILEKDLHVSGLSMEEILKKRFGENTEEDEYADEIVRFCSANQIRYELTVVRL